MDKDAYTEYRQLKNSGVSVQKRNQVRFNAGSETSKHVVGKALAAKVCLDMGYRVSSEVEVPNGEIDIVAYGHPERLSYAIEIEHSINKETKDSKLQRYVYETAIDDMILIEANDIPENILDALGFIKEELGMYA